MLGALLMVLFGICVFVGVAMLGMMVGLTAVNPLLVGLAGVLLIATSWVATRHAPFWDDD